MKEADQELAAWARELTGAANDNDVAAATRALRAALNSSDRALNEAAAADTLSHARLIKRLEAEGLLGATSAATRSRARPRWQLWIAAAATLLVGIVVSRVLFPPEVFRGEVATIEVPSVPGGATLESMSQQLQALGLQPRMVTIDGVELLEVDVPLERLNEFAAWAEPFGGKALISGRYHIRIKPADDAGPSR